MNCSHVESKISDYLASTLGPDEVADLEAHLETCGDCQVEVESLRQVWDGLGVIADETPSSAVGDRFYAMLDGYRQAAESASSTGDWLASLGRWWTSWWPQQPVRQLGWTLAAVVAGLLVGTRLPAPGADGDVGQLRDEVADLSRLVGQSLLEQGSASERLRGVSYSRQGAASDPRVLDMLLRVAENDADVNVRLAAIDALAGFTDRREVLEGLRQSLPQQQAPLAQLALVDVLLAANGTESRTAVRSWLDESLVDDRVRAYAEDRLAEEV